MVGLVETFCAPDEGEIIKGAAEGALRGVVNDAVAGELAPESFFAMTCQLYVDPPVNPVTLTDVPVVLEG